MHSYRGRIKMSELNGTEIVKLIGLPETDDRVLDLIELLGVDVSEIERSEYNDDYTIDLDDELGLMLSFTNTIISPEQEKNSIGGLFLNDIAFYEECTFLPFEIEVEDSLESIEEKIGLKSNYRDIVDIPENADEDDIPTYRLHWVYKELGWFSIQFFEPTFTELASIHVMPYENPNTESYKRIVKPFER